MQRAMRSKEPDHRHYPCRLGRAFNRHEDMREHVLPPFCSTQEAYPRPSKPRRRHKGGSVLVNPLPSGLPMASSRSEARHLRKGHLAQRHLWELHPQVGQAIGVGQPRGPAPWCRHMAQAIAPHWARTEELA